MNKKNDDDFLKEEDLEEEEEEEEDDLEEEEDPKINEEEEEEEEEEDDEGDNEDYNDDENVYLEENKTEKKEKPKKKKKEEEEDMEIMSNFSEKDYMSEEDSDIDEEDSMLQKLTDNVNTKFLEDIHVETKSVNYDEMIALARVVKDKNGKIIDPLHKTLPFLTKYEKARIIGARAEQLDRGGEAFIPLDETIINGRTIALMEFEAKKIPFIIARPLSNGSVEYWHLHDLEII
jgi:DNA-directed RNA polymerase subunit K/omega